MTRYVVKVQPLTVVHVGTGEEFGPMEYTIREQVYYRFRPDSIIATLDEENRHTFSGLLDKGEFREIALFLHQFVGDENSLYAIPADPSVSATFKGKQADLNNQLLIKSMYRSLSTNTPIIPGSSLKGAIRTAVLDDFASQIREIRYKRNPDKEILNYKDAKEDPFRTLKVSDCEVSGNRSQAVVQFVNFKEKRKSGQDFSKMQIFAEMITGVFAEGDAIGWCEIQLDDELLNVNDPKNPSKNYFHKRFTLNEIISACNTFYLQNLRNELEKFYRHSSYNALNSMAERLSELENVISQNENQCLIRVGQFSQVENVTLSEHREPWNKKGYGNTRTITSTYVPAGWIKLTFLSEEEAEREQQKQMLELEKEREEEKKREAEEKARKEKEEQLAGMLQEDRLIALLPDMSRDETMQEVYPGLASIEDANKRREVAQALRERWVTLGSWNGKQTPKQQKKIQVVKDILGES